MSFAKKQMAECDRQLEQYLHQREDRSQASVLKPLELGTFGFGPKNTAHLAWSKTETTIHVYGIGPFSTKLIDPVYKLTGEGTFLLTSLLKRGTAIDSSPPDCFALRIGAHMKGAEGEGDVVGARCSPANHITQYWIQKTKPTDSGQRWKS